MSKVYVEDLGKEFDTDKLEKNFATLEYQGKPLYQIEDSFPDGTHENPVYKAYAIDLEGNRYIIIWNQYAQDEENECFVNEDGKQMGDWSDGANACDWDDYIVETI